MSSLRNLLTVVLQNGEKANSIAKPYRMLLLGTLLETKIRSWHPKPRALAAKNFLGGSEVGNTQVWRKNLLSGSQQHVSKGSHMKHGCWFMMPKISCSRRTTKQVKRSKLPVLGEEHSLKEMDWPFAKSPMPAQLYLGQIEGIQSELLWIIFAELEHFRWRKCSSSAKIIHAQRRQLPGSWGWSLKRACCRKIKSKR